MDRRTKIWLVVAALFCVLNIVGAGLALAAVELPHAGLHVALALASAYAVGRLAARRRRIASY